MTPQRGPRCVAAIIALGTLVGCGADNGMEGDCSADLQFQGTRYEIRSDLSGVRVGPKLGAGDFVACAPDDDTVLGHADVYTVRGVHPDTAIATVKIWKNGKQEASVFVLDTFPRGETPSSWPSGPPAGR
jgi:hypothetical protein